MNPSESITYFAISPAQLERVVRDAITDTEFASAEMIYQKFGIKPDLLESMAKDGELTRHKVGDHKRPTLYRIEEVRKLIKPVI